MERMETNKGTKFHAAFVYFVILSLNKKSGLEQILGGFGKTAKGRALGCLQWMI